MSDLDMQAPPGAGDFTLAEVCLCLPSDWPLAVDTFGWREPKFFWPIKLLMQAARYAHRQNTWLCWGHTIGDTDEPEPIDQWVDYTGVILLDPLTFPEGAGRVETFDGGSINYLALIPLLHEEMLFARREGSEELAEILDEADVTELVRPQRGSVV